MPAESRRPFQVFPPETAASCTRARQVNICLILMSETSFHGRRASFIENELLRVTVLHEGGHIAEILDKATGVNPLWIPPWPSIEPSTFDRAKHPDYGTDSESKLLAGIMGHNLCLDIFGEPSEEEAAAGLTVHGEGSIARYDVTADSAGLTQRAQFPIAQLRFERQIRFGGERAIEFRETLENLSAADRPIAWTQHVTLGPPFLERGRTEFRASATRSRVFEGDYGQPGAYQKPGADFDWPNVPNIAGGSSDLRVYNSAPVSAGFTMHLWTRSASTLTSSPSPPRQSWLSDTSGDAPISRGWAFGRRTTAARSRPGAARTLTRGMEFGASPVSETRRKMIERNRMFGVPCYRWIPAKTTLRVNYWAMLAPAERVPETLSWSGDHGVRFES